MFDSSEDDGQSGCGVDGVVHPFDLKSALFAKHAQHVVLVHFPIALFLTGVVFDIAARWTKSATRKATLAAAARLNLLAAAVAVVPTLATGIVAWQWQLAGQKLKGLLLLHLVFGCTSSFLICLVGWIHFRQRRGSGLALPGYYLPLELLTAAVVALTAHLGGFLSGVNVPG
jgi:uncharacterized membrane protein